MRTVQEHLKEADLELIRGEYYYKYPVDYEKLRDKTDLSMKEVRERIKENFLNYINRLQNLQVQPCEDGKEYILYAHNILKDGFVEEGYSLICLQELMEGMGDIQSYAYYLSKQEEIMGFYVADTEFTQKNLYGLLAEVLYEASFFGLEQEHLEEERKKLEDSVKELDVEIDQEFSEKNKELEEQEQKKELKEQKEEVDETADKLRLKVLETTMEFEEYCKKKELDKIRESIRNRS